MEHLPAGQLRMVHLAPAAHWMVQDPSAQVSISQVAPAGQLWMEHPTWQLRMVHLPSGPQTGMLQPPEVQAPRVQVDLAPAQVSMHPPPHLSMVQVLPAPQELM
jgi:hypothetical protein